MDTDLSSKRLRSKSPKRKLRKSKKSLGYGIGVAGLSSEIPVEQFI